MNIKAVVHQIVPAVARPLEGHSWALSARKHVPDFLLITTTNPPVVVDVKPKGKLNDVVVSDTLRWTRAVIEGRGWRYEVWSEPPVVELNNLRFLAGFRRAQHIRQDLVAELQRGDLDSLSLREAMTRVSGWPRPLVRAALLHLLWLQHFDVDLSRPLTASLIRMPGANR